MLSTPLPRNCHEIALQSKGDERGNLIAIEGENPVPFPIQRVYYVFDTVQGVARGHHAHQRLQQVLISVAGQCTIKLDDGHTQTHIRLDKPTKGLFIGTGIWREMYDFTSDCVLLVLASEPYDANEYIRDYDTFLKFVAKQPPLAA